MARHLTGKQVLKLYKVNKLATSPSFRHGNTPRRPIISSIGNRLLAETQAVAAEAVAAKSWGN